MNTVLSGKGGRYALHDLARLTETARRAGADSIGVLPDLRLAVYGGTPLPVPVSPPRLASSVAALGIRPSRPWLNEAVFYGLADDLAALPDTPDGLINLVCPLQDIQPRHAGHLNFIAAERRDFWHLTIRLPDTEGSLYAWPQLVGSSAVAALAARLLPLVRAEELTAAADEWAASAPPSAAADEILPPEPTLPYLENIFGTPDNRALCILSPDRRFALHQWEHILRLAERQQTSDLFASAWGGIWVKNLSDAALDDWHRLLHSNRLGIGQPYSQTVWQYAPDDEAARSLCAAFVQHQLTHGLRLWGHSISVNPPSGESGTSCRVSSRPHPLTRRPQYTLHAVRADGAYTPLAAACSLQETVQVLSEQAEKPAPNRQPAPLRLRLSTPATQTYRCGECLMLYTADTGAPEHNIPAGTAFADLPDTFCCPVCAAPLSAFEAADG